MNRQPDPKVLFSTTSAFDGRDPKLQQWVTDSGAVALLADNYAVEATPARPCADDHCAMLPLHAHCLFKLGCYLGEMFYLTELADWLRANERSRFLFTGAAAAPARRGRFAGDASRHRVTLRQAGAAGQVVGLLV